MVNPIIAYSPRSAGKAFSPPLSERIVRKLIREGIVRPVMIGRRTYLLADEIVEALRALGSETK
jgi:hypothetical protein